MEQKFSGYAYIIGAAILWGTTGTSQALAPVGVNPLAIGTIRILVGGVILLALALIRGGFRQRSRWDIPSTVMAALTTALYQVTFFGGTRLTGVAVGTVVGIGSAPIFAGLLGILFDGEKRNHRWEIATGIAVLGCFVLLTAGNDTMIVNPVGIILSLSAGLSYALFTLFNKRLVRNHPPDEVMAVSFCLGALILTPLLFFVNTSWIMTTGGLVIVLHLGLFATGLSYALFGRGLQTVAVSTIGTLTLAEPLTAALLGIFVVHESLTLQAMSGIGLIFAGLMFLTLYQPPHKT